MQQLGLGTDIIIEACSRTLLATHQASFPYANKILEDWKRLGVRSTSDIKHLDDKHRSSNAASLASTSSAGYAKGQPRKGMTGTAARKNTSNTSANQFHNFEQRTYDYSDLESSAGNNGTFYLRYSRYPYTPDSHRSDQDNLPGNHELRAG